MEDSEASATPAMASDSSGSSDSEPETELMVTTRAKRATAGNRYNSLVAQEEVAQEEAEDDDVALLFAETEGEDEAYQSDDGAEDADMSSSDDDDEGPNAATGDLEGEKEIEKEAKAERSKKRKADLATTTVASLRKKPRIDPTSLRRAPAPKPVKRKERASWLPDQDSAPGRTSLRKQTILHRAETHAKLKVNEELRLKQKAIRAQRERDREADAPKELTQADRLAEAANVERRNAKSLNRWEATEKKRMEEQAARLAALKERKLQGPVISLHSAAHTYHGLKEKQDVAADVPTEGKKRGRKSKAYLEQLAAAKLAESTASLPLQTEAQVEITRPSLDQSSTSSASQPAQGSTEPPSKQVIFTAPQGPQNFLTGIQEYASMPIETAGLPKPSVEQSSDVVRPTAPPEQPHGDGGPSGTDVVGISAEKTDIPGEVKDEAAKIDEATRELKSTTSTRSDIETKPEPDLQPPADSTIDISPLVPDVTSHAEVTSPPADHVPVNEHQAAVTQDAPVVEVVSTRNLVILDRFEDLNGTDRNRFSVFYNSRKTAKPVKQIPELCPITGLPARHRDPVTGMGYHNANAFKKLRELQSHQYVWSSMLGCYVGRKGFAARGIPDGFLSS